MSGTYIKQTNQALAQARVLIEACESAEADHGWSQAIRQSAFQNATLFQLMLALNAYRREIADTSNIAVESISTLGGLVSAFEQRGALTGEVTELQSLQLNPDSWLCRLESAYLGCWNPDAERSDADVKGSEIQLFQINAGAEREISVNQLQVIYTELSELINRQRSAMQEW